MNYIFCKLSFSHEVHIGNGSLTDANYSMCADTFFSALCHEAIKSGGESSLTYLIVLAKTKKLRISNGFPYIKDSLYIPKPLVLNSKHSKFPYIPMENVEFHLQKERTEQEELQELKLLGRTRLHTYRGRDKKGDFLPFYVGTYQFYSGNGMYFIIGYKDKMVLEFIKNLMSSLQYTGIGGKKSNGFGQFWFEFQEMDDSFRECLCMEETKECDWYMTVSDSLPSKEEISCLDDAIYKRQQRGGFIVSETYTQELYDFDDVVPKKEIKVVKAGSCMKECFKGQMVNVNNGIGHDVYRYEFPLFWRIEL